MSSLVLYTLAGAALALLGLWGVLVRAHLIWKMLAINVMAGGTFLILIAAPPRLPAGDADPVPQAMVLTGIVVAVATTAFGLGLALRVAARTGRPYLVEELPPSERKRSEADPERGSGQES